MRSSVLGLLLPLLLGCSGQNVVAGDEKTKAEQLEASVPSWCESTCSRLLDSRGFHERWRSVRGDRRTAGKVHRSRDLRRLGP